MKRYYIAMYSRITGVLCGYIQSNDGGDLSFANESDACTYKDEMNNLVNRNYRFDVVSRNNGTDIIYKA